MASASPWACSLCLGSEEKAQWRERHTAPTSALWRPHLNAGRVAAFGNHRRVISQQAASEAIWLPTSLLPRFGVEWTADDWRICAGFSLDGTSTEMYIDLEPDGKPASVVFDRWGDPDGEGFGAHAFGCEFTSHGTFAGLTIPTR